MPRAAPPPPPKKIPRPPNPWIIYRSHKLKELAANPDFKQTQAKFSQVVSLMWKRETAEVRAYYDHLSDIAKAKHREKYPDYRYIPMKKQDKEAAKVAAKLEREAARAEVKLSKARSKRSKQIPPLPPLPFPTVSSWADPEEIFAQTPSSSRSVSPRSARASRYKPYPTRPAAKRHASTSKSPATPPSPSFINTLMPSWVPPAEQEREQEQQRQQQGTSSSSSSRRSPSSSSESMFEAPSSTTSLTVDRSGMTFDDGIVVMGEWIKPSPPPSPPPAISSPEGQWPSLESGPDPNVVWDNEDAGDGFSQFLVSPGANENGHVFTANNTLTLDIPTPDPLSFPLNLPSDVTAAFATATANPNEPFEFELNLGEFKGEAPTQIDVAFADWAQKMQNAYWATVMGPPNLGNMAPAPELAPLTFDGNFAPNFFTTPPSASSYQHQHQHQERLPSFDFSSFMGINGDIEVAPRVTSSSSVADPFAQYTNENASYEEHSGESLPSPTYSHDGMPVGHTLGLHFPSHVEVEQHHHHNELQSREDERDSYEQPRHYSGPIFVPQPRNFTGPIDLYQDAHGRIVSNGSTSSGSTATYHTPHVSPAPFASSPPQPQPRPQYAPPPGAANSGGRRVGASWGNYRMMQTKPLHEEQEEALGPLDVGRRSTSSWVQQHQHSRVSSHRSSSSSSSPLTLTP